MDPERPHTYGHSGHATTGDGRRLHYMATGEGSPTVVLESGLGLSRSCWGLVAPELARRTRVVVYDRANLGRSDPDGAPRTLERLTDDLGALLDELEPGPFVLVGHSWGGAVVRAAAARTPGRVAGLVLVDQVDEHCDLYLAPAGRRRFAMTRLLTPALARVGLYRLAGRAGAVQPEDVAADHRREDFGLAGARGMAAELEHFVTDLQALRDRPPDLAGVKVTVLTGTRPTRMDRAIRAAINEAHRQTAAATGGRLVEAPNAAHLIPFDEPGLVVAEVAAMLAQRQEPLRTPPSSAGSEPSA